MNLNTFLDFLKDNIDFFSKEEINFIITWQYNELLLKLDEKLQNDKKNKKKYNKIINFFIEFIEDIEKNAYKYNYIKSKDFKQFKYWFDFYIKNKLFSQAEKVLDDMKQEKIDENKINKLSKILKKEKEKYSKEYKKVVNDIQKENIIKNIEFMVKSWQYQKALILTIKAIKIYPDDKDIQNYIDKINQLKTSNLDIDLWYNEKLLSKIWMIDLIKKKELERIDLKIIYKKLKFLLKIKDYETWLKFISFLKNSFKLEDKKILRFFNKFIELRNNFQKNQQQNQFDIELRSIQLMMKNKQYKDALLRANMLLRKYPFIKKKKLLNIIKNIKKNILVNKNMDETAIDRFLINISYLNKKGLYEFYQKMAWFLKSKIDIKTSLNIIYHQAKDLGLKKFTRDILAWIEWWMSLSESMKFYKQVDQLDLALIKVWENTWKLSTVFENIYKTKKEEDLRRKKIKSIMIYPSIVIGITIIIFIWLLVFIIPKFVELFKWLWVELPYLTQKILELSNFVRTKWYIIIISIFLFIIFYKLFSKTKWWKYFNSYMPIYLPVVKKIIPIKYIVYFTSNLSLLLKSWISITESLDIIIYWTENILFKNEFTRLKFEIEWWLSLWKAIWIWDIQEIWTYSNLYIPIDIAYTMDIWDKTWQLASLLEEISQKYDEELKLTIKNLQSLIEPFIILLVWWIVFLFAISVFLPLLQMYDAIWHKGWL